MKNLKKVLALVLAGSMLLSSFTVAFAAEVQNTDKAEALYNAGLFSGKSTSEFVPALEDGATRVEAMVVLAYAFGWDLSEAGENTFSDVPAWAADYVALAAEKGVTAGIGNGLFGADQAVTQRQLNAWFYNLLGFEGNAWATPALAEAIGLPSSSDDELLRDELVGTLYEVITEQSKKDSTTTIIEDLVTAGVVAEEVAVAAGLKEEVVVVPEDLEVVSVKAINLVQTEVVFNMGVDEDTATDVANYTIEDTDGNNIAVSDAELLEDGVTVVLTHANAGQQTKATVAIEDIEDLEEVAIADFESEEVEYLDMTIPTVIAAEVVGNDTIKVTFSEPMDAATVVKANFEVNDGDLYINTATPQNNNTEALIVLYSDLEEGTVEVSVSNDVEDAAGFGVVPKTLEATVTEDDSAPVVVGYKNAKTTEVTLVFDEQIEIADATAANYYHTNSGNPIANDLVAGDLSDNGKELTLDFTGNELPEGTAYVYILKESINDLWDNENSQIMFEITVEKDETAPVIEELEVVTQDQITIEFDEDLDADIAEDKDNYTVLDADGEEVEIDDITYANKVVTVDFDDDLSGVYSIVIENIEDASENEMDTKTLEFEVDDMIAPVAATDFDATLFNAGAAGQMVKINFGEKMATDGKYSVLDIEKYVVDNNVLADLDADVEIKLVDNGEAVEITVESTVDNATDGVDLAANNVVFGRVADAAGNYTALLENTVAMTAAGNVLIDTVEVVALDKIEVTFDDLLDDFNASDIIITTDNTDDGTAPADSALSLAKRSISTDKDGNTVVTITLVDELEYNATTDGATSVYAYIVSENSENKYGETVSTNDNKVADDKIAADLYDDGDDDVDAAELETDYLTVDLATYSFTVKFSENVQASNLDLAGNDFVVTLDNEKLVNGVDYLVTDITADTVTFTLQGDLATAGHDDEYNNEDIEVELADTTNYVTDMADNDLADFSIDEFVLQ